MDGYNESSSVRLFLRVETGCYCTGGSKAFRVLDYSTDLHSGLRESENNCPTEAALDHPRVQPHVNQNGIRINFQLTNLGCKASARNWETILDHWCQTGALTKYGLRCHRICVTVMYSKSDFACASFPLCSVKYCVVFYI